MKKTFTILSATVLLALAAPVSAHHKVGHDNGGNGLAVGQEDGLLAATKCGNKGDGNDGEVITRRGACRKNVANEDHRRDVDPGNSGD